MPGKRVRKGVVRAQEFDEQRDDDIRKMWNDMHSPDFSMRVRPPELPDIAPMSGVMTPRAEYRRSDND